MVLCFGTRTCAGTLRLQGHRIIYSLSQVGLNKLKMHFMFREMVLYEIQLKGQVSSPP